MWRTAVFACLMVASLCLPSGADAAKKLPEEVSFDEFVAFLQKAVGDDVEVRQGITGYVATSGEVSIGWIGEPLQGKTGDALVAEAMGLMQLICDKPSLQMSAIARQTLDGIRLLRRSFECRNFGPISQYGEAIVLEDGERFETFYNGALAQHRRSVVKVSDGMVRVLVETYR